MKHVRFSNITIHTIEARVGGCPYRFIRLIPNEDKLPVDSMRKPEVTTELTESKSRRGLSALKGKRTFCYLSDNHDMAKLFTVQVALIFNNKKQCGRLFVNKRYLFNYRWNWLGCFYWINVTDIRSCSDTSFAVKQHCLT